MRILSWAILLIVLAPPAAQSQSPSRWTLSLLAGPSSYDLAGTGTVFAAAAHLGWQWTPALVIEPGITYFHYQYATILFPEVSAQVMVPRGPFRPYFGVGVGRTTTVSGSGGNHRSLHAALGARVPVAGGWGIRAELRARSPQQWGSVTADYMVGVSRRLP